MRRHAAGRAALLSFVAVAAGVAVADQDTIYRAPLRPACDASTVEGEGVRLSFFSPELNTAQTPVVAPWQRYAGEIAEDPRAVLGHLDLARCMYVFIRGLGDVERLNQIEQSLARAIALIRDEEAAAPAAVPPSKPPPYRTGRDVPMPKRIAYEPPAYPSTAEQQQISGTVFVEATIDSSGRVRRTRIAGSIPPLDEAAEAAVRAWRYEPAVVGGRRVEVVHMAALRFSTEPESAADHMDIGRFHYARQERPNAMVALTRALDRVRQEQATIDPKPAVHLLRELQSARPFRKDSGGTGPAVVTQGRPKYTREAMQRKITGSVEMDAVVLSDGTVGAVRIVRSLDPVFGLDVAAVHAAKQWRFQPATDASGTRIPTLVRLLLDFRLH